MKPETWEPRGVVPADAVHVTSTAGATALIVCTVDVAICVVPPNVRLQFDVVLASAVPVLYKVKVQVSGSPEHEVRSAETWAVAELPVPTKKGLGKVMAMDRPTPTDAIVQTMSHVLNVFLPTPFPDMFATSINPSPPLKRPASVRKVASKTWLA